MSDTSISWGAAFEGNRPKNKSFRIAFWPLRGGIGTTTCALIAAWKQASLERKTVLVDMCFHQPNDYREITHGWDVPPDYGTLDWLAGRSGTVAETNIQECQYTQDWSQNMVVAPVLGEDSVGYLGSLKYSHAYRNENGIAELIQTLENHNQARTMVFDCPPGMNPTSRKVINESDHVVILHSDTASEWMLLRSLMEDCENSYIREIISHSILFSRPDNCDQDDLQNRSENMRDDYQKIVQEFPLRGNETTELVHVLEKDAIRYGITTGSTMPYPKHFAEMQSMLQNAWEAYEER